MKRPFEHSSFSLPSSLKNEADALRILSTDLWDFKNNKMVSSLLFIFRALVKTWKLVWAFFSLFCALVSNSKKVPSAFYTFYMLIKNLVKRYRVYFYCFPDSLKLDHGKITLISFLSSFQTLKMWKDCRVKLSSLHS